MITLSKILSWEWLMNIKVLNNSHTDFLSGIFKNYVCIKVFEHVLKIYLTRAQTFV